MMFSPSRAGHTIATGAVLLVVGAAAWIAFVVATPGSGRGEGDDLLGVALWVAGSILAGLGILLIAIGLVRRRRARNPHDSGQEATDARIRRLEPGVQQERPRD